MVIHNSKTAKKKKKNKNNKIIKSINYLKNSKVYYASSTTTVRLLHLALCYTVHINA